MKGIRIGVLFTVGFFSVAAETALLLPESSPTPAAANAIDLRRLRLSIFLASMTLDDRDNQTNVDYLPGNRGARAASEVWRACASPRTTSQRALAISANSPTNSSSRRRNFTDAIPGIIAALRLDEFQHEAIADASPCSGPLRIGHPGSVV